MHHTYRLPNIGGPCCLRVKIPAHRQRLRVSILHGGAAGLPGAPLNTSNVDSSEVKTEERVPLLPPPNEGEVKGSI